MVLLNSLLLLMVLINFGDSAEPSIRGNVNYDTITLLLSPTNILKSNFVAGANIYFTYDSFGRLTIGSTASGSEEISLEYDPDGGAILADP